VIGVREYAVIAGERLMEVGSVEHKELFCRSFMESHRTYEPERLPWPDLKGRDLQRLRAMPFWEEILNTERAAGAKVNAYAATVSDPLLRDAITLQGVEETRHAKLLEVMIAYYNIPVGTQTPAPLLAKNEKAFIDFGYGECLDAFLGFGVFKLARQAEFLPDAMFSIFDLLMEEETRHIVFFVNWVAYLQVSRGHGTPLLRALHSLWYYGRALQRLVRTIRRGVHHNGQDFSATQANVFLGGLSMTTMLTECVSENARRMSSFDGRLLQPRFLPALTHIALSGMQWLPKRQNLRENRSLKERS
jgi:hypothetical protein